MPRSLNTTDLRRVLVVQTAFLGDVLLTLPLLRAIKNNGAEFLAVATTPQTADAIRDCKEVDELILLDKQSAHRRLKKTWAAGVALRTQSFTSSIIPHRSFRSALFGLGSGAPVRVGFRDSSGSALMTHRLPYHVALPDTHRQLSLLSLFLTNNGIADEPWFVPPRAQNVFSPIQILLAPGSQWGAKRWPLENFRALIAQCLANNWKVMVTGSASEKILCDNLCRSFVGQNVLNISGTTSWDTFRDAVAGATIVVANDTAAVHTANIVGTPVVALFGPTVPEFGFAPRGNFDRVPETHGLVCRPCNAHGAHSCPLGTHVCMTEISVDQVFDSVCLILKAIHGTL